MRYLLAAILLAITCSPLLSDDVELIFRDGKWVKIPPPVEGTPEGESSIVRRDFRQQRYTDAVDHANRFLKRYPDSPLKEEVFLYAGDAELKQERYWQAFQWYEKLVTQFPNGNLYDQALGREMEVAGAFLAGKKRLAGGFFPMPATDDGLDILHKIAERAPGSDRAEVALLTIAEYYFNDHKFGDAAGAYDAYLRLYPKSPRAPQAEYRAAESNLRDYRGPLYDDVPLIEAQQRFTAFADHYPAAARQADVAATLTAIKTMRAARLYETVCYYLRVDRPESAAEYCKMLLRDYPNTQFAGDAEKVLVRLGYIKPRPAPTSAPSTQPYTRERL